MGDPPEPKILFDDDARNRASLAEWIEKHLGGQVTQVERQDRWRPAWYVTVKDEQGERKLYVRGDRGPGMMLPWPLEHEMSVLSVLHRNGIPVPKVHGICPLPRGIVMDCVDGTRDLSALSAEQRQRVMQEYIFLLHQVHSIDPAEFGKAGIHIPASDDEAAMGYWSVAKRKFEVLPGKGPDAFVAFLDRWLRSNLPLKPSKLGLVTGDAGQFLQKDGKIVALIDFEIAYIGDTLADLGGLRIRNLEEPFGDADEMILEYRRVSGIKLDTRRMNHHAVILAGLPQMTKHTVMREVRNDAALWRTWEIKSSRICVTSIADELREDLERLPEPERRWTRHTAAYDSLVEVISTLEGASGLDAYGYRHLLGLAKHLRDVHAFGPAADAAELAEMNTMMGTAFASLDDAEAALEDYVAEAHPTAMIDLLHFFDRRFQRRRFQIICHDLRLALYDLPPLSKLGERIAVRTTN